MNVHRMGARVASLSWMLAMSKRVLDGPPCSGSKRCREWSRPAGSGSPLPTRSLPGRGENAPARVSQDGIFLSRLHELNQHAQRATVQAESDRECRGLLSVALQLSLFDAAAAPPNLMGGKSSRRC